ncbi:MAG: hypothetical protein AAES65_01010 [Candidatus Thiodiazotropha sp. (ex. Lucinoma kazani)]
MPQAQEADTSGYEVGFPILFIDYLFLELADQSEVKAELGLDKILSPTNSPESMEIMPAIKLFTQPNQSQFRFVIIYHVDTGETPL